MIPLARSRIAIDLSHIKINIACFSSKSHLHVLVDTEILNNKKLEAINDVYILTKVITISENKQYGFLKDERLHSSNHSRDAIEVLHLFCIAYYTNAAH